MKKWLFLFWVLGVFPLLMTPLPGSAAKEDTAHMSLRKTAVSGKTTQEYVVQKGDNIDRIVQKFMQNASHRYSLIKELNPELKDLRKIYPGQTLILPVLEEKTTEKTQPAPPQNEKVVPYQVKQGDSMSRILKRQLHVKEAEIPKTLKLVRKMNPGFSDLNRLSIGQTIMLPAISIAASTPTALASGNPGNGSVMKKTEIKPLLPPEKDMNLLQQLISRSHGSLIRKGSYYIPLPQTGRVTLDCSAIPVVEFDDGSTVLLDFGDRIPKSLQKLIVANWKNISVLKVRPSQDIFLIFQGSINASASYTMKKGLKPLLLEKEPQVLISFDWIISPKNPSATISYFHGILLASDKTKLLPVQIRQYAEQKGFQFTEILNGEIPPSSPAEKSPAALELPSIATDKRMDLIFNLLVRLGYAPVKNQELKLLNNAGTGINLSVKPDILLKTDSRELLIFSKKPPRQLFDVLSRQRKEVLVSDTRASKQAALSQILSTLRLPYSAGRYAFYIAEKGRKATITITLSAIKIERKNAPLYLIGCGLDPNLYLLLNKDWNAELVRY
jgi:LysM repeat protein